MPKGFNLSGGEGGSTSHPYVEVPVSPPTWRLAGLGAVYDAYARAGKMPKCRETPRRPQTIVEGYSEQVAIQNSVESIVLEGETYE